MDPPVRRAPIRLSSAFAATSASSASAATSPMPRSLSGPNTAASSIVASPRRRQGRSGPSRQDQVGRDEVMMLTTQDRESGGLPVPQLLLIVLIDRRMQVVTQVIGHG